MIRLVPDHSTKIRRTKEVSFTFDGARVSGHAGESLAVALMRSGYLHLRAAPTDGAARGAFCCMGLCQECVVQIDGSVVESCRQVVTDNLVVASLKRETA